MASKKKAAPVTKTGVEETMREFKEGKLRSGSGKKVESRQQAVAIGLSEERKDGKKVPPKKSGKKK